jgi:hypothetical protein
VRGDDARRAHSGDRSERGGDHGHGREVLDDLLPARQRRDVGEPGVLQRLDRAAAAGAIDQADERHAQLAGGALGPQGLLPDGRVGGAAADLEVVALRDRRLAVDAAGPDDHVRRQEVDQVAVPPIRSAARHRACLVEAAGVEEPVKALADREAPGRVLARDALLAAHAPCELLAAAQLVEFGLPPHGARSL